MSVAAAPEKRVLRCALMTLWKRKTPFTLVLVAALLLLLPVLAYFQYRWLGQVSQAERDRMKTNLHASTAQFCEDFDRELTRVYVHFQSEPDSARTAVINTATKLAEWRTRATLPRLVENVYWIDWERDRGAQLWVVNEETHALGEVAWPAEFDRFRASLKTAPEASLPKRFNMLVEPPPVLPGGSGSRVILRTTETHIGGAKNPDQKASDQGPFADAIANLGPSAALVPGLMERIIEEAPAVVIPIFFRGTEQARASVSNVRLGGFVIAKLDDQELKTGLLESLASKHFGSKNGLEYQVLVASKRDPSRVIYRSNESIDAAAIASQNDESAGLFSIRPEFYRTFLVSRPQESSKALSSDSPKSDRTRADHLAVRVITGKDSGATTNLPYFAEIDGYWKASLKHRAGSLEAAVGSVRRRSLALSFGILLLLGASVVLLLISTRRAQRLAEQQMEFVAGVSHELRTPLAVIRSAAENLADGFVGDAEQVQKYGALIRDEGRRLTGMVEQVLEVASAQSGKQTYQQRPVNLAEIIASAVAGCRAQLEEGQFALEQDIASDLPLVNVDSHAVARAVENLITNAIKYSGESRWIGLRAARAPNESDVFIDVSDRGIGIQPGELEHVFDPFFRGREVLEAQIHGSGLGLSLVKHIVESHSGTITVNSSASGTTFRITLPAHTNTTTERSARPLTSSYEQTNSAR